MSNKDNIQIINRYQGMINSKVASLLNKGKKIKESINDEDELNRLNEVIDNLKLHEANVIKLLNKYCSKLEK